MFTGKW